MFLCVCSTSVSSALLPHAAPEEEGASRRGHSGEGRLKRPPPVASVRAGPPPRHLHLPYLIFGTVLPRAGQEELYRLSGNTFTVPLLQELETEAGVYELFFSPASLPLFTSEKQHFITPELTPDEKIGSFSWRFFKARISTIQFFHTSRINRHFDNMLLHLCMSVWILMFLLHIPFCLLGSLMSL